MIFLKREICALPETSARIHSVSLQKAYSLGLLLPLMHSLGSRLQKLVEARVRVSNTNEGQNDKSHLISQGRALRLRQTESLP